MNNLSYNTIEKKNNTAIFNMIPCIFPAGWHPSQGQCALVLCPPRAGKALSTRARPVLLALAPGHNPVVSTLPSCPAVVLKLQDNVNLISLAQQGCRSSSTMFRNVHGCAELPVQPASQPLSKGLQLGSWSYRMESSISKSQGQMYVLSARHKTVFAFTQSWGMRPRE